MIKKQTRHWWEEYYLALDIEYIQSMEEGKNVEKYKSLMDSISAMPDDEYKERLSDVIFELIQNAPQREGFSYVEPDGWEEICAEMSEIDKSALVLPSADVLKDKIYGAWTGRVCGCLLGKPIEGVTKEKIIKVLKSVDNYPMKEYLKKEKLSSVPEMDENFPYRKSNAYIDLLDGYAPSDDDTNYTAMALTLVEENGLNFSSDDMRNLWLKSQVKDAYCTAERVAYINFVNGYTAPNSAKYKNVFREWIGAQIRGDYFGYINPCDVMSAANMAWRDARISHVKNGIYGEMFSSAMISAAASATTLDMPQIIKYGISVIPKKSRLYVEISEMLRDAENGVIFDEAMEKIYAKYDDKSVHDWCHTISNARIVCAALLYGKGDFGESICKAVQSGFDTDCNGATVGSILGIRNGMSSIDSVWYNGIEKGFKTTLFGLDELTYEKAVKTTLKHIEMKKVAESK